MSHFQLPNGTRLWDRDHQHEKLAIHSGNEVELEQWASTDAFGKMPRIQATPEGVIEVRLIDRPSSSQAFTISTRRFGLKAIGAGTATLNGKDSSDKNVSDPLKLVAGDFKKHEGMEKDLLAEVGQSSNAAAIYKLQRLLQNDSENLFDQFNNGSKEKFHSPLACGSVAKAGGDVLFGRTISHSYEKDSSYHQWMPKVNRRDDVVYDENLMRRVRLVIGRHVKRGNPVLIGCAYDPQTSMLNQGHLQATRDGGHSVLIVGCNAAFTKFLYVDPLPGGSNMKYKGGIAHDSYPMQCHYLGEFHVDSFQEILGRGPVLRQRADTQAYIFGGNRYLEVISGPKI